MRIAICDDVKQEREQLVTALHEYDPTRKPECYVCGKDLLAAAVRQPPFDIVFLDIYMPGENGVEIASQLQALSPETGIVFVTTSTDHAVDAFSLHALHYLVKPVTAEGVIEALRRLTQRRGEKSPVISLPFGNQNITISLDEISYVRSDGHNKELVLRDGRIFRVYMTLEELEPRLGRTFLKLNRSVLVNMGQIERMGADSCLLKDGVRLDFGRRERARIRAAYDEYLFFRLNKRKEGLP